VNTPDLKNGLLLGSSAVIAMLVIVAVYQLTLKPIQQTEQLKLIGTLEQLLPANGYDNNPATDTVLISDAALSGNEPSTIYRARVNGEPAGAVISCIAPDGYNGNIHLLVGLNTVGDIMGVRVTQHTETPGLGDDIEATRSDWIYAFNGLSLESVSHDQWQVKKDGGQFDQFTGATITPRAIVSTVYRVAQWYQKNQSIVFSQPASELQGSNI